jgi:hypothetical protein
MVWRVEDWQDLDRLGKAGQGRRAGITFRPFAQSLEKRKERRAASGAIYALAA